MRSWRYRYVGEGLKVRRVRVAPESPGSPEWPVTNSEAGPSRLGDFVGDPAGAPELVQLAEAAADLAIRARHFAAEIFRRVEQKKVLERSLGNPGGRVSERAMEARSDLTWEDIRRARHLAGLSQSQLAKKVHYSRGLIAEVERRQRSVPRRLGDWAKEILLGADEPGP